MPSRKVSMRASMANQTSHLGIMGGLAKGRTSGASGNRATNKLVIPRGAAKGLAYMQMHGILSRNPQSGGVGKVVKSKPCTCNGSKQNIESKQNIGSKQNTITNYFIITGWGCFDDLSNNASEDAVNYLMGTLLDNSSSSTDKFLFKDKNYQLKTSITSVSGRDINIICLPNLPVDDYAIGEGGLMWNLLTKYRSLGNIIGILSVGMDANTPYIRFEESANNTDMSGNIWCPDGTQNCKPNLSPNYPSIYLAKAKDYIYENMPEMSGNIKIGDISSTGHYYCDKLFYTNLSFINTHNLTKCFADFVHVPSNLVCADTTADCRGWATAGQCDINPSYMEWRCAASCNIIRELPCSPPNPTRTAATTLLWYIRYVFKSYGFSNPLACPPGQGRSAETAACGVCPSGTAIVGGVCTACPAGQYIDAGGDCSDCPIGTYSDTSGATTCSDCSNGTTIDDKGFYKEKGAHLCLRDVWPVCSSTSVANVGGLDPHAVGSTTQGYFCCASGNDGLFQLSGTPDCSGIGVGSGNSNLCRLTGPIAPGACSKPSCNAVLGCSSLDNESETLHPGAGEECSADAYSNQADVAGCIWDAAAQSGHCPSTSCHTSYNGGCYVNPNPTIPSPAMVGCSSIGSGWAPGADESCTTNATDGGACVPLGGGDGSISSDQGTCPATSCFYLDAGCTLNPYLPYICSDKACVAQIVDQSTVVQPVMSLEMCKKNC